MMSSKLSLAIVFISSFCLMVIELVAGRLMAPYLGVSLYTWTSVIGVILAGISLGNYLGGKIADSFGSRQVLGGILLLSGATSLLVRFMVPFFGGLLQQDTSLPLYLSTFIFSFFVFFPASLFLGCISPIVVKLDLHNLKKTGNTVGRIYAFGTLGSILGTFATGYFLISLFGTKIIILSVALILLLLGVLVFGPSLKFGKPGIAIGLLILVGIFLPGDCLKETNYYCININSSGEGKKYHLKLDHLIHSYVDLENTSFLKYDYEKSYAILVDYFSKEREDFSTFFLGGGGYTMPRYLENNFPLSKIEVAEIDPGVTEINYEQLGLSRDTKIQTQNLDARIYLQNLDENKKYDLIFGDAFNDYAVPYHLTTLEFNQLIKNHLSDNGFYAVNIIDDYRHGRFLGSYIKTMKEVFENVYLVPLSANWTKGKRNTFVVVAGKSGLDKTLWINSWPENVFKDIEGNELHTTMNNLHFIVPDNELEEFLNQRKIVFLTDDYVPIDNLLASVFVDGY